MLLLQKPKPLLPVFNKHCLIPNRSGVINKRFIFLFAACANFCSAQKKEAFDYPEYLPTDDSARAAFKKQFYQGQVVYRITCAKCHNKMINGKEVIPDFSLPQLMHYEIRIYPEH